MSDLIEKLEWALGNAEDHDGEAIEKAISVIQSLRAQLAASQPLLIEDMPDEWKDGRDLVLIVRCNSTQNVYTRTGYFHTSSNQFLLHFDRDIDAPYLVLFAMAPPTIPVDAKNATTEIEVE